MLKERIAVAEANRLGIPVIGMVDTNSDPNTVDYVIPANDDASKSIELIAGTLTAAIAEGLQEHKIEKADSEAAEAQASEGAAPRRERRRVRRNETAEPAAEAAEVVEETVAEETAAE